MAGAAPIGVARLKLGEKIEGVTACRAVASPLDQWNEGALGIGVQFAANRQIALSLKHQHGVEGWQDPKLDGLNHSGFTDHHADLPSRYRLMGRGRAREIILFKCGRDVSATHL
jgi:hypothetical protein